MPISWDGVIWDTMGVNNFWSKVTWSVRDGVGIHILVALMPQTLLLAPGLGALYLTPGLILLDILTLWPVLSPVNLLGMAQSRFTSLRNIIPWALHEFLTWLLWENLSVKGQLNTVREKCPLWSPDLVPSPAFAVFLHTPKFKEFLKYHQLALKVHAAFYISNQIDISYIKSDWDTLPGSNSCLKGRETWQLSLATNSINGKSVMTLLTKK